MKIRDIATMLVESVEPSDSLTAVARKMLHGNIGFIPVVERGKAVGVVTDRDIVIRGVAQKSDLSVMTASDIMTKHVYKVNEAEQAEDAAWLMVNNGVRRLLVVNQHDHPIGVVSLDDLALFTNCDQTTARVLTSLAHRTPEPA